MRAGIRHVVAYVILAVGLVATVAVASNADQRDIHRNCRTGQRSWDTLSAVVHTAYETRSLAVDPKTLPPETQKLLAALAPLLKSSAGAGHATEKRVLAELGGRPIC